MLTANQIKSQAKSLGFDLCGISAVDDWSQLSFLDEWLQKGCAGECTTCRGQRLKGLTLDVYYRQLEWSFH